MDFFLIIVPNFLFLRHTIYLTFGNPQQRHICQNNSYCQVRRENGITTLFIADYALSVKTLAPNNCNYKFCCISFLLCR